MNPHSDQPLVGLDLSLTSTGIAWTTPGTEQIFTARVRSTGKKTDTWKDRRARLRYLAQAITEHVPHNSLVGLEAPSYASTSGSQHDRSGLWWLIYDKLAAHSDIIPITPAQRMTYAVGKGGGTGTDKDNILAATIKRYPQADITGNDEADATILLAITARLTGNPLDNDLPKSHLRALDKLQLPQRTTA